MYIFQFVWTYEKDKITNDFPENTEDIKLALRYFMCLFSTWERIYGGRVGLSAEHRLSKTRRAKVLNRGIMTDKKFLRLPFILVWLFDNILEINHILCTFKGSCQLSLGPILGPSSSFRQSFLLFYN